MEFLSLFVGVVSVLVCSIGFEGIEVGFSTSLPVRMHVRVRWVDHEVHKYFVVFLFRLMSFLLVTNSSFNCFKAHVYWFFWSLQSKEQNLLCISS